MVQVKMPHKTRLKHIIATPHLCLHLERRKYDAGECEQRRNYPLIHKQGRVSTTEIVPVAAIEKGKGEIERETQRWMPE